MVSDAIYTVQHDNVKGPPSRGGQNSITQGGQLLLAGCMRAEV